MACWEPWARWAFNADFDLDGALATAGLDIATSRYVVDDIIRYVVARPPAR